MKSSLNFVPFLLPPSKVWEETCPATAIATEPEFRKGKGGYNFSLFFRKHRKPKTVGKTVGTRNIRRKFRFGFLFMKPWSFCCFLWFCPEYKKLEQINFFSVGVKILRFCIVFILLQDFVFVPRTFSRCKHSLKPTSSFSGGKLCAPKNAKELVALFFISFETNGTFLCFH